MSESRRRNKTGLLARGGILDREMVLNPAPSISRCTREAVGINPLSHRDHCPWLTPPVQKQGQEAERLVVKRISAAGSMQRRSVHDLA
jgi:hypothetical protein